MKEQVLVTGGCGFIGSHLVELLVAQGHKVRVLDNLSTGRIENIKNLNASIELIEADINNQALLTKAMDGIDWVFHLAALADIVPSIQCPEAYYRANVEGTFSILEAARKAKIKRFVYTASSSCYGIPDDYPTSENAPSRPQYPYALTKMLGEQMVMHWAQVYGLPALSLRLFNVYGVRSRTSGSYGAVLGVFLRQKLANTAFTVVGDGQQTRDFTEVSDVARAFYAAAQSDLVGEIFNVGSGRHVSVNYLVELLQGQHVNIPKRPGEPDCTFADITKITEQLNWSPIVSIEDGITKILEQIDYWRDAPLWNPDSIEKATEDWFKYLG